VTAPDPPRDRIRFGHQSTDTRLARPFGRVGGAIGAVLLLVVIGGLGWSAASGRPAAAQHPHVFGGSLVLGDTRPLTVIDVATAEITVRLEGVNAQVGAANYGDILPVPVSGGTMLVNRVSGSFNFLGSDDYVTDPHGPGVSLGALPGSAGALGLAAGSDAFVLRAGPRSTVSLVGPQTVAQAARLFGANGTNGGASSGVSPLGSASIDGSLDLSPGGSTVTDGSLWALYGTAGGCQSIEMTAVATSRSGLAVTSKAATETPCRLDAVESDGDTVGLASPGKVQLMSAAPAAGSPGGVPVVNTPFTSAARAILPVTGATNGLWYLAQSNAGWQLFGADTGGRVEGPFTLTDFGPGSAPAVPVLSKGVLYTLDQNATPQPTLWTIDVANGRMSPLTGTSRYPVLKNTEKDSFHGVQVLLDGPRVVFNNPQSLDAVVVFTDSSRLPAVVNKSLAVSVSATGPADLNATVPPSKGKGATKPPPRSNPVPVVQPVSQQITCATTTQKPYAPQITALTPSSSTVTVTWTYQLLDQTDCEPDSWAVEVTALTGGHPPLHPIQFVTGQNQFIFGGLRPTTTYQVIVTAYINNQSTPSSPATFATSARGPDAPLSVTTTADGLGNWVVSWTPCTEAANPNCVVPAATWSVIGSACGGNFVGNPPTVQVSGDKSTATISADQLQLLGDSLTFSVQGSLPSGLTGDPTSDHACTQAWEKPSASDINLESSAPPPPSGASVVQATLQITVSGNLARLIGAHPTDVEFVYSLAGQTFGPTSATTPVSFNVAPGVTFTPTVRVYPAGHPDASVTVPGPPVHQTIAWPDLAAGVTASGTVDPQNPNQGSFTVNFPPNLPSGPLTVTNPDPSTAPTSGPVLQCGGASGTTYPYPITAISNRTVTFQMDDQMGDNLVVAGGNCTLSFTVTDNANPNPYGVPTHTITADFTIGQEPVYAFQQAYTTACSAGRDGNQCGPGGQPWQLVVSSTSPSLAAGGSWNVTSELRDQQTGNEVTPDPCQSSNELPGPNFPYTLTLPVTCDPDVTPNIDVIVSFHYIGQKFSVDAGYPTNDPGSNIPLPTTTTSTTSTTTTRGNPHAAAAGASALGIFGWTAAVLGGAATLGAGRRSRLRNRHPNDKGTQ
jgi:hypothetical protein